MGKSERVEGGVAHHAAVKLELLRLICLVYYHKRRDNDVLIKICVTVERFDVRSDSCLSPLSADTVKS